jgi:hypothetical protein
VQMSRFHVIEMNLRAAYLTAFPSYPTHRTVNCLPMLKALSHSFKGQHSPSKPSSGPTNVRRQWHAMQTVETKYTSKAVDIPTDFLLVTPPDAAPITVERVNFSASPLPEYSPYYASVLDNVLSKSECAELLLLAEQSSPTGKWEPAMVNAGIGREVFAPEVRLCER